MDKNKQELNPYEAPKSIKPFSAEGLTEPAYADGMDLVFREDFVSPRICLISGRSVAKHVEPMKFPLFRFYMKNYLWVKVLYIAIVAWFFISRFFMFENSFGLLANLPLYALLGMHLGPFFSKKRSHFDFYYVEFLRAKQTRRTWKMMLVFIPSVAVFIYGFTVQSYLFTVLGMMLLLNYVLIVLSGSVLKIKQGDKHYYRLGDIHPAYLERLPKLNDHQRENTEVTD